MRERVKALEKVKQLQQLDKSYEAVSKIIPGDLNIMKNRISARGQLVEQKGNRSDKENDASRFQDLK